IPNASIIGLDMSWYMLTHQVSSPNMVSSSLVQARAPSLPFKRNSLDAIVAVQFLSEVFSFSDTEGFLDTITQLKRVLKEGGALIVLDHQSPGEGAIELRFPQNMIEELKLFQTLFQVRHIEFEALPNSWIRITLRDLYDFLTKVWSFGTALEDEEMRESHTPFTGEEFSNLLMQNGFSVECLDGVIEFENYLKQYDIDMQQTTSLPNRFLIVSAFYKE
ncbi:MAG: class I SAM-dependent methyltransferase, partial [Candidatus Thorarchaeota archaeon]